MFHALRVIYINYIIILYNTIRERERERVFGRNNANIREGGGASQLVPQVHKHSRANNATFTAKRTYFIDNAAAALIIRCHGVR